MSGGEVYEFGPFRLDATERTLTRGGEPMLLPPKAFDTLRVLVRHSGHAVRKAELLQLVWPDAIVEENNLTQYVSLLRKTLGNGGAERYIETIPRWGYRFVAEVRDVADGDGGAPGRDTSVGAGETDARNEQAVEGGSDQHSAPLSAVSDDANAAGQRFQVPRLRYVGAAVVAVVLVAAVLAPTYWSRSTHKAPASHRARWTIEEGGNGHYYEAVAAHVTWDSARKAAAAKGGHLATIASAEENAFVFSLVSGDPAFWVSDGADGHNGPWLGGLRPDGAPTTDWRWVTGESFDYSRWGPGEPNNLGGSENRLVLHGLGGARGPVWNDWPGSDSSIAGYVIEYETRPGPREVDALLEHAFHMIDDAGRGEEAIPTLRELLRTDPNNAKARWYLSEAYRYGGMLDESIEEGERALRLNPRVGDGWTFNTYFYAGRYDAFIGSTLDQDNQRTDFYRGLVRLYLHDTTRALADFDHAYARWPAGYHARLGQAFKAAVVGDRTAGTRVVQALEREGPTADGELLYKLAQAYALLGDRTDALRVLRLSIDRNFVCYPYFARDPFLASLRGEPEYTRLIEKARERHESFKRNFFE